MSDIITHLGSSLVQHGPDSDRIYLMELDDRDMPALVGRLEELARERGYGKIFARVPDRWVEAFQEADYQSEAMVPGFYRGTEAGYFMGRYLDPERAVPAAAAMAQEVLREARDREIAQDLMPPAGCQLRPCGEADLPAMAALYGEVFPSYPFPIHDQAFLAETMAGHVDYFGAFFDDRLVALCSAERYDQALHAEMTDFATHPDHRRQGLALLLLKEAEDHAKARGFATAYTIARALSPGMNITFARAGYSYAGTLVNNTQISGHIESMNVWYKALIIPPPSAISSTPPAF